MWGSTNATSNQFPVRTRIKPTLGHLYYRATPTSTERVLMESARFSELTMEKKRLGQMGYRKAGLRVGW